MEFKNLDKEVLTLNGAKIMLTGTLALTYRSALVSACETYQGDPGTGEMLKAYSLGMKIMNAKDKLEIAKEEVDFLKKVIESNRVFMSIVVGRLLEFINNK